MTRQCPDCAGGGVFGVGNGKCSKCYGIGKTGTIADDIAGVKPGCTRCHGTGKCPRCGGGGLVSYSPPPRAHANTELNPFDDKVAVRCHCPKCGDLDWFKWKFLGRLTDPVCGHSWYVGSGAYTMMQIRAALAAGDKCAKYGTSGISGEAAWIGKAVGWITGIILGLAIRLEFGLLMIPIQALAGLSQAKKTTSDIVTRVIVLCVALAGGGILFYELQDLNSLRNKKEATLPMVSDTAQVQRLLPPDARIIEAIDLTAIAGKSRSIVLWMLSPKQVVRRLPVGGCSDGVYGDYWYGPTRLSLADMTANIVMNTITIRKGDELNPGRSDTFNIPFAVSNQYYYVKLLNEKQEGQPTILHPRGFSDKSAVTFPLFDYEECGQAATGAFGYSVTADQVMQFPIEMKAVGWPPRVQMWATQIFAIYPQTPAHWRITWQPAHGSDASITDDVSYEPTSRKFVDQRTITRAP
jgi:hypothetical protein